MKMHEHLMSVATTYLVPPAGLARVVVEERPNGEHPAFFVGLEDVVDGLWEHRPGSTVRCTRVDYLATAERLWERERRGLRSTR